MTAFQRRTGSVPSTGWPHASTGGLEALVGVLAAIRLN